MQWSLRAIDHPKGALKDVEGRVASSSSQDLHWSPKIEAEGQNYDRIRMERRAQESSATQAGDTADARGLLL